MSTRARLLTLAILTLSSIPAVGDAAPETWKIEGGKATLSLDTEYLAHLGMSIAGVRETATPSTHREVMLEPPLHSFRMGSGPDIE